MFKTVLLCKYVTWSESSYEARLYYCPISSNSQHLSYDGCLEVRGEIIRTVLSCIVY